MDVKSVNPVEGK